MKVRVVLLDRGENRRIERITTEFLRIPISGEYVFTPEGAYIVSAVKWTLDKDLGVEVIIEAEGLR